MLKNQFIAKLKDGTPTLIRYIRPEDKKMISDGLSKLSFKSRFFRFFSPIRRFSNEQLKYLTEIDQHNHLALGAAIGKNKKLEGIGIARYIKIPHENEAAEVAITIIDEFQNRGLGTILFKNIIEYAKDNKIKTLIGYLHRENMAMLRILKKVNSIITFMDGSLLKTIIPINENKIITI